MFDMINYIISFFKDVVLLKYVPDLKDNASFGILFVFGIMTSFHCIAMCGGIIISQTVKSDEYDKQGSNRLLKIALPSFLYNLGRIISYTVIGAVAGGIGQVVGFLGILKGIIPIIGGIFMIIAAINLLGVFKFLRRFNITMPICFAKKIRYGKIKNSFLIGVLSAFMPCGPLQIIQLYALGTKSIIIGGLSTFFFAIGTVPVMFIFGIINTFISNKYSYKILKVSAVLILFLGIVMVNRGLNLIGVNTNPIAANVENDTLNRGASAVLNQNVQNVTTEIQDDSYEPIIVQKGIPVRWTIKVKKEHLNECNNKIIVSKFKIEKKLEEGDNIIEFTPLESGEVVYTCWMGMIESKIIIVNDLNSLKNE
jgi:sulfite exporter TauE/SafE